MIIGWCVRGVCLVCAWCVRGVCLVCDWCASGLIHDGLVCAWCVPGVCLVCAWCVPGVCLVCAWCEGCWSPRVALPQQPPPPPSGVRGHTVASLSYIGSLPLVASDKNIFIKHFFVRLMPDAPGRALAPAVAAGHPPCA